LICEGEGQGKSGFLSTMVTSISSSSEVGLETSLRTGSRREVDCLLKKIYNHDELHYQNWKN